MIKHIFSIVLVTLSLVPTVFAQIQADSAAVQPEPAVERPIYRRADSATLARRQAVRDSVKQVQDSLSMVWVGAPDPNRPNRFADSLIALYKVENLDFAAWASKMPKKVSRYDEGRARPQGEVWVIVVVLFLVLFFAT